MVMKLKAIVLAIAWCGTHWLPFGSSTPPRSRDAFSANGLHYAMDGEGAAIVLIHAFHMDLREWDEVAPELSASRRVLRYDVRGHGRSSVAGPLPSPVADLSGLLDELRIARATLTGSSMGATIALELALMAPSRVERLIMVAPGVPGVAQTATPEWLSPVFAAARRGAAARAADLWWSSPLFDAVRSRGQAAAKYRQIVADNARIWTVARAPGLNPPAATRLEEIALPVTVIAGDLDQLGSLEIARAVAGRVRNGQLEVVEGAGHMITLERPTQLAGLILNATSTR
jgi:pimeloyl-ACP methyl ester carboxylesterase